MEVINSNHSYSAYDSSSEQNKARSKTWYNCYEPDATLLLVFDVKHIEPEFKRRIRDLWRVLSGLSVCDNNPHADNYLLFDKQIKEETPEPIQEPVEENGVQLLFEKMLAMRMDQHALAIADGYRTRPQVCVCDNVCCNCFDYSNFLHNLKLHNRKELLRMVYAKMTNKVVTPDPKPEIIEPSNDGEEASIQGEIYDEFTLKNEEDYEGDDPKDVDLDLTIIDRVKKMVCSEKTVCPERTVSAPARKIKRGVRVIKIDEPPYETKFNTVHRRVREFDPNSYKTLVREEIKRLNEMSVSERRLRAEHRIKNLSQRPPWKI